MPIDITDQGIGFPFLHYSDFSLYLQCHRGHVDDTLRLEDAGRQLFGKLLKNSASEIEVMDFFESVFDWGGNQHELKGKVLSANTKSSIVAAFQTAAGKLSDIDAQAGQDTFELSIETLRAICKLKNLGISYGSKVLRLLRSDLFGVRDSKVDDFVLYENVPTYEEDKQRHYESRYRNFAEYSSQCVQVAEAINGIGVSHPDGLAKPLWDAGDVDAVIFTKIQILLKEWT